MTETLFQFLRRLRWAFSNRVVATDITVNQAGYFLPGDWLDIGGELHRVWVLDNRRLVLSVY